MPDIIRSIDALQPGMREMTRLWLNDCRAEKLGIWLNETLRTFGRQAHLFAQGRTRPGPIVTRARPGQSLHSFGLAVDAYPIDKDGDPIVDFDHRWPSWRRIVVLAKGRGLAWGGDWRGFKDFPHFQDRRAPWLIVCRRRWPRGWQP